MRISDWSSDVCSSDLRVERAVELRREREEHAREHQHGREAEHEEVEEFGDTADDDADRDLARRHVRPVGVRDASIAFDRFGACARGLCGISHDRFPLRICRSEEHTSELQSLMSIPYAVFRLKT